MCEKGMVLTQEFDDGKPTSQAESAPGDIDHLRITGGKGILQQESRLDAHGAAGRQQPNFGVAEDRDGRSNSGNGTSTAPWKLSHAGPIGSHSPVLRIARRCRAC